jgi:hypothetical protein
MIEVILTAIVVSIYGGLLAVIMTNIMYPMRRKR